MYILETYKAHSTYIVHIHIYNMYIQCMYVCMFVCVCQCFFWLFPVFAALPKLWQNYETLSKKEHKNKNQSNRNNICTYIHTYVFVSLRAYSLSVFVHVLVGPHVRPDTVTPALPLRCRRRTHCRISFEDDARSLRCQTFWLARANWLLCRQVSGGGEGSGRGARERGAHSQLRCGTTLSEPAKQHETREFQSQLGDNVVAVIVARVTQPILIYAKRTHTHTQTCKSTTINSFTRVSCSHILSP